MEFKSNITPSVLLKMNKNLHNKKNHPLEIIKRKIYDYFGDEFEKFDNLNPIVNIENNFNLLLIDENHPSRSLNDTYYTDENHVLRTHTSCHQNELLKAGHTKFLVTGDVFRKDSTDSSHSNLFHQMEIVSVMEEGQGAEEELKKTLNGLINHLFPGCEHRLNPDSFPFTHPSFEVEVMFQGKWLEVLGAGVVHKTIMKNCGLETRTAFAAGLGIERLAMVLFEIPDIRYFLSDDERFKNQFISGEIIKFKPYSNYPMITRDLAFWTDENFVHNDFYETVREIGSNLVENVSLVDEFTHPKTGKQSKCFRMTYRSNDRTLTNEEINEIQENIKSTSIERLNVEIR